MDSSASPNGAAPQAKRKIRNFLIDRRFQLGWVARVAFVTALILGATGYFLFGTLAESTDMMVTQTLAVEGLAPSAQRAFIEQGKRDKQSAILELTSGLVGILVLLSLMTIVATHKIAGPAYKMKKLLSGIDGDHLQLWAKLRKGDELHDMFEQLEEMLRRLREARHKEIEEIETALAALRGAGAPSGSLAPLEQIAARFRRSIEMG
jgi:hypothetical protein